MFEYEKSESLNAVLEFLLNPPEITHFSEVIAHNLNMEVRSVGALIVEINASHPDFLVIEGSDGEGAYSISIPAGAREKVVRFLDQGGYLDMEAVGLASMHA
jgi:hypothetical protein